MSFQWTKGKVALRGETNGTLVLDNVQVADTGSYAVEVVNQIGQTNATARLVVQDPPKFVSQPESSISSLGAEVDLWTDGTGSPPLTNQWFFNGTAIY